MRRLKLMSTVCAAVMSLVMAVSLTGCGDDASSVSRAAKTTTKSVSEDKDTSSKQEESADTDNNASDDKEESSSADSKSEESKPEENGDDDIQGDDSSMTQEEWEEWAQSDEYMQRMACQAAGQEAHEAVRKDYGEGDWTTNYPTILSYTDKENYEISVEIYKTDEPDTVHTYIFKNTNGEFSIEKGEQ